MVYRHALTIDGLLRGLRINLDFEWGDIKNIDNLKEALNKINADNPVDGFENWYYYLFHIKSQLLDLIRSMTFYNEYLSRDFFQELLIIEQRLMSPFTFAGHKIYNVPNLSHADLDLQELLLHNQHLQKLREKEFKKYEKEFNKDGKKYRQTYYSGN